MRLAAIASQAAVFLSVGFYFVYPDAAQAGKGRSPKNLFHGIS